MCTFWGGGQDGLEDYFKSEKSMRAFCTKLANDGCSSAVFASLLKTTSTFLEAVALADSRDTAITLVESSLLVSTAVISPAPVEHGYVELALYLCGGREV